MRTTRRTLSDGRDVIYFDRDGMPAREAADRGGCRLPTRGPSSASTALLDEWVSVAAHRQDRTFLPATVDCPLCPAAASG